MSGRLESYEFQGKSIVRDVFVETGTYLGETTQHALNAGYKHVHTIEVCDRLVVLAKERFAGRTDVTVHHGSSPDVLPFVCDPKLATTFYLDGHFQGGAADETDPRGECPLLQELAVIRSVVWETPPIIIIDDAHIFIPTEGRDDLVRSHHLDPAAWPLLPAVVDAVGPAYNVVLHDDRLYCIPESNDGPELEEVPQVAVG